MSISERYRVSFLTSVDLYTSQVYAFLRSLKKVNRKINSENMQEKSFSSYRLTYFLFEGESPKIHPFRSLRKVLSLRVLRIRAATTSLKKSLKQSPISLTSLKSYRGGEGQGYYPVNVIEIPGNGSNIARFLRSFGNDGEARQVFVTLRTRLYIL